MSMSNDIIFLDDARIASSPANVDVHGWPAQKYDDGFCHAANGISIGLKTSSEFSIGLPNTEPGGAWILPRSNAYARNQVARACQAYHLSFLVMFT